MQKLIQFLKKYEFPMHIFAVQTVLNNRLSISVSTWKAKLMLKLMGCLYGKNFRIDGRVLIWASRKGTIRLGDNVIINSRVGSNLVGLTNPAIFECIDNGAIIIGNGSGLSAPVLSSRSSITIGENVKIGGNVRIFDHDYHALDFQKRRGKEDGDDVKTAPVIIGNDVFVGTNALILKGVTIGDRAIIGAGTVVSRDVPADEIWVGNPAKFNKKLRAGII